MFGKFRNLNVYIKSLDHLRKYDGRYDVIYPMHGTIPVKPELIDKLVVGVKETIEVQASSTKVDMFGNDVNLNMQVSCVNRERFKRRRIK